MRRETVKTVLTAIFVTCMVVANILAAKQVQLPFGLTITAGAVVFPITYALSDVFSECYGYRWSRFTCYLALAANLIAVTAFAAAIAMPAAAYWDGQEAFAATLGSAPRILLASAVSYVVGDLANDRVFRSMKDRQGDGGFCIRAFTSSVLGEIFDSGLFYLIAFAGVIPAPDLIMLVVYGFLIKTATEIAVMPITSETVRFVKGIEG